MVGRRYALLGVLLICLFAAPSLAAADVTIWAPYNYASATEDEQVRFSWVPNNSEDYFTVVFSQTSFGLETSPYSSRETLLTSTYLTPSEVGLTPGTWYWTICAR